ncbi:FadR/GntR family transcriptional regulator [Ensifer sp. ENS01]|uniref:FadR/GntR family transcriptional regulator n=1 Tax=Ensifer sp. ENS01 TaxID=2769293 RepID=UPI0017858427|nr:FadR/GntR family transcriptional regulator [Ensifer sp. ENS01]MBD9497936.1 FadR family transcriptional regulator [Ensifer sp. ENS01]
MTDTGLELAARDTSPERLSDVVYDGIVALIARGDLRLNSRLPSETDLSTRFAVSRPVVREALGRLREDGVVVSRQGSGTYVKRQPDVAVLRFAQVGSLADVQRCFEFRAGHEAAAAALAAERWQEEDLQNLREALEVLERCVKTGTVGIEEDRQFHEAVARATRNPYYISIQESLAPHIATGMNITRQLSLLRTPERLRSVQSEHDAIFEAIGQRDSEGARLAMQRHILNARQRMFEGV